MWCTPTSGSPRAKASALAAETPTRSEPIRPGRYVTAMPASSSSATPARARASSTTGIMARRCERPAISGTTPRKGACSATWLSTTEERISRPRRTTAAAVSSQEDSMPSTSPSPWSGERVAMQVHRVAGEERDGRIELPVEGRLVDQVQPLALLPRAQRGERALGRRVAEEEAVHVVVLRFRERHEEVGRDAAVLRVVVGVLDAPQRGTAVARRGELHDGALVAEALERLDRALAEARLADEERRGVVLQRGCQDLARAGGSRIEQHDERQAGERRLLRLGLGHARLVARARRDQRAVLHEAVRDRDGRVQDAAGVGAQVEHERAHPGVLQSGHGLVELLRRAVAEGADREVADAVLGREHARVSHGRVEDDLGPEHDLALDALQPLDGEVQVGLLAVQERLELARLHRRHGRSLGAQDAIADPQPGLVRRRAGVGEEDPPGLAAAEDHADAQELAAGLALEGRDLARRVVVRVAIEVREHAVEGVVDEFVRLDLAHELLQRQVADGAHELDVAVEEETRPALDDHRCQEADRDAEHEDGRTRARGAGAGRQGVETARAHARQDSPAMPSASRTWKSAGPRLPRAGAGACSSTRSEEGRLVCAGPSRADG